VGGANQPQRWKNENMAKRSAGLLMYRWHHGQLEIFLVHPGGPFWAGKELQAWSIPKGEYREGEPALEAAEREFQEETGFAAHGNFIELGSVRQAGGKLVSVWAFEGDCDPKDLISNRFQLEWPSHSGRLSEIPEVDRGDWFSIDTARKHILKSQTMFLDRLSEKVNFAG